MNSSDSSASDDEDARSKRRKTSDSEDYASEYTKYRLWLLLLAALAAVVTQNTIIALLLTRSDPESRSIPCDFMGDKLSKSEAGFHDSFRMYKNDFLELLRLCRGHPKWPTAERSDGRTHISDVNKLGAVLYFLMHGQTAREIEDAFGISHGYFTKLLPKVLHCIVTTLQAEGSPGKVQFPSTPSAAAAQAREWSAGKTTFDHRWAFLKNCIGAIDGTLIPIQFKKAVRNAEAYRCRKGFNAQNVLLGFNHDKTINYARTMIEGCVNDATAIKESKLERLIPANYYVLCDGGAALTEKVITPYKGVRYHLNEFAPGQSKPQDEFELFNLRHSIKRASRAEVGIGLLKARFRALTIGIEGSIASIRLQTMACIVLHNFIQRRCGTQDVFTTMAEQAVKEHNDIVAELTRFLPIRSHATISNPPPMTTDDGLSTRERLTNEAFEQYQEYLDGRTEEEVQEIREELKKADQLRKLCPKYR